MTTLRTTSAIAIVAMIAMSASEAAAQARGGAASVLGQMPGAGLAGSQRLNIQANGRATYDSNVARGDDSIATLRDVEKKDIIYSPSISADIVQPSGIGSLFLRGSVGYNFYQDNSKLQSEQVDLGGGVQTGLGLCAAAATGGWTRNQSDLADVALTSGDNISQTVTGGLSLICTSSAGFGVMGSAQQSKTSNTANRGVVDSTTTTYTAGLTYRTEALGTASLYAATSESGYDDPALGSTALSRGFRTNSVGLSLYRPIGARLTGQANISYQKTEADDPSLPGLSNIAGSGSLTYQVTPRLQTSFVYFRSVTPSVILGYDYVQQEAFDVSGSYAVTDRLRAGLGARWGSRSYKGVTSAFPVLAVQDEDTNSVFATLTSQFGRRTSLTLDARREVREATPAAFDYTSTQVAAALTISWP